MPSLRSRLRRMVEAVVPWFDREQAEWDRARLREELAASRAVRARATETIQEAYREYAQGLKRR